MEIFIFLGLCPSCNSFRQDVSLLVPVGVQLAPPTCTGTADSNVCCSGGSPSRIGTHTVAPHQRMPLHGASLNTGVETLL